MFKASFKFLMVFVAGCPLLLVGLMGSSLAECPRPIAQFPAAELHCSMFTAVTGLSLLLMAVGAVGILVSLISEGMSERRRVGRSA